MLGVTICDNIVMLYINRPIDHIVAGRDLRLTVISCSARESGIGREHPDHASYVEVLTFATAEHSRPPHAAGDQVSSFAPLSPFCNEALQ